MNNQTPHKSLFWIITTFVITTAFISGLIGGIILTLIFILALVTPLTFPDWLIYLFYFCGMIAGLKYALNFIQKRTEIWEGEVKKIAILIGCFPFMVLLFVLFPYQIYYRGLKVGIELLWINFGEYSLWLIGWVLLGFLVYYWLRKRSIPTPIPRKKINRLELIISVSLLIFIWIPPIFFKEDWKKELGSIILTKEERQEQQKKAKKTQETIADWMITSYMEEILGKLSDKESYSGIGCDHPDIKSFCKKIEKEGGIKPTIYSSSNEYCAYIKLYSGKYFCIDTTIVVPEFSIIAFGWYVDANPSSHGYCTDTTFLCPVEYPTIGILSPIKEEWREGETRLIKWEQRGFEETKVKLCLTGDKLTDDGKYIDHHINPKESYVGECGILFGYTKGYQIETDLPIESGEYQWKIPTDLSKRFLEPPDLYKIWVRPLQKTEKLKETPSKFDGMSGDFRILK